MALRDLFQVVYELKRREMESAKAKQKDEHHYEVCGALVEVSFTVSLDMAHHCKPKIRVTVDVKEGFESMIFIVNSTQSPIPSI